MEETKTKIEKSNNPNLEHIYTDSIGNLYYTYKASKLPLTRYIFLQGVLNQMAQGIEAKELSIILDEIADNSIALSTADDIVPNQKRILYLTEVIKQRTRNILQMDLLLQAALCAFVLEGEPDEYSEFWNNKKLELWKKDNEAKFFFAHLSLTTIRGYSNTSIAELKALVGASNKNIT